MKFIHTADLHIGKNVNEFSMLKEQEHVLNQILSIAKEEKVDALLIAGDIYDRSVPSSEAVVLLDTFLSKAINLGIQVFAISGNHDSPERIGFAYDILKRKGLYMCGMLHKEMSHVEWEDAYGKVNIYLLPFAKPAQVRYLHEDDKVVTCEDSVRKMISNTEINQQERNLLITHHFVTSGSVEPECSDSETRISIGGTDNVDSSVFEPFDYVALGHIHGPQRIGRDTIRYSGSPIKYSFSEVYHKKSVTLIELKEKGNIDLRVRELSPLHDMRRIKGELNELLKEEIYKQADVNDYLQVTLTNKQELLDPMGTLRSIYPNVMQIIFEKNMRKNETTFEAGHSQKRKTMFELYHDFFEYVTGDSFEGESEAVMRDLIEDELGGEVV
jgi:exonuclease SbcD